MVKRREPDRSLTVTWDGAPGGNIEHLAEHGVTADEFEQVLAERFNSRQVSGSNPRYWLCRGYTHAGRFLHIVFEYFEDQLVINPVTAYEPTRR